MAEKEQHNPPREDNKILQREVDHAVRDADEGNKYAEDAASRVKSAAEKLEDEIQNTVKEGSNETQTSKVSSRRKSNATTKQAKAADAHIGDEVAKASGVSGSK